MNILPPTVPWHYINSCLQFSINNFYRERMLFDTVIMYIYATSWPLVARHRLLSMYQSSTDQAKAADQDSDGAISENEFLQTLFLFADTDVRGREVVKPFLISRCMSRSWHPNISVCTVVVQASLAFQYIICWCDAGSFGGGFCEPEESTKLPVQLLNPSFFTFLTLSLPDRRVTQAEFMDGYRRYYALPSELLVIMFDLLDDLNDDGGTRPNMDFRDNRNNQYFQLWVCHQHHQTISQLYKKCDIQLLFSDR